MTSARVRIRLARPAAAVSVALAFALAGCGSIDVQPPDAAKVNVAAKTKPSFRWTCPPNLSFVRGELVTPQKDWDSFLGQGVMNKTLNQPLDVMIKQGGGYEPSVASGRKYVAYYQDILNNPEKVREEYRGYGKTDGWIDTYMLTVRDGVTINQAFVDAVECRRENGWLEAQRTPDAAAPKQP
jgi:hypothetical protein